VLLDHCMDRIRPDWHGDGRGSFGARADGGKGSGADGACDGTNSEEPRPVVSMGVFMGGCYARDLPGSWVLTFRWFGLEPRES
jgi:hypothetical protein